MEDYLTTWRRLDAGGDDPAPGSEVERAAVERFRNLLSDFKAPDFAARVRDVYAQNAFFNDTLRTVHGVDAIEQYLAASAAAIDKGLVELLGHAVEDGDHYFRWTMTLRFKRLASDEDKRSIGMTHVRFDRQGRVVLHQDFWDSSAGLFEHVPALGWVLRRAKERL